VKGAADEQQVASSELIRGSEALLNQTRVEAFERLLHDELG
jgi:hypothetical protein